MTNNDLRISLSYGIYINLMIKIWPAYKAILSSEKEMLFHSKISSNYEDMRIIHMKRNEDSIICECIVSNMWTSIPEANCLKFTG